MKPTDDRAIEQRRDDRRQTGVGTLLGALFLQRRRLSRRIDDKTNTYIDWYDHWHLATTLTVILLCSLDAFLTIILLDRGAIELNFLMAWLIDKDIQTFTLVKLSVTGVALIVLVMHINFRIYRIVSVRYLMYALVPAYSLLIAHEINLLANI
jgi:hypothetical protein